MIYQSHNICMLKLLQAQSQTYFKNKQNYSNAFSALTTTAQRTSFYTMLIVSHLGGSIDPVINYLGQASTNKMLDCPALLTSIWAISLQLNPNPTGEEAKKLFTLVSLVLARNIIDKSQLVADLPQWVSQGAGLVDTTSFERRTARVYTKINYQQSKYSLMRENNEGYAKMNLLLINLKDTHNIASVWKKMLDLVGNFDLDPDRVLDLIIQARVHNHTTNNYLKLLSNFRKESIATVLGNKFKFLKGKPIQPAIFEKCIYAGPVQNLQNSTSQQLLCELGFIVNPYLINFTAQLIKVGIIAYCDLIPYLEPADYVIRHINSKKTQLSLMKINKCFKLSMQELDPLDRIKILEEENLKFQGQLLYSSKLALICEILKINDWVDFSQVWAPYKNKIDLLFYQPLLHQLLNLIEWALQPLFEENSFQRWFRFEKVNNNFTCQGSIKQYQRISTLDGQGFDRLTNLLGYVGKYVAFRPRLFIKICRLFKRFAKQDDIKESLKPLINDFLMAGSCLAQGNAPMSIELFNLLQCYQYKFRYNCYLNIYRGSMSDCPYVTRIFQNVKQVQNKIVNTLSKQNKKLFTRKISKLTHNQALPVFYWIIRRIVMQDYEAVVPEIVAVLINCSPMTLDIAIFVMLFTLNQNRQPVNRKTHECQPWFKNVTTFISNFFRKYLQVDIQPVFDYIITKTGIPISDLEDQGQLPGALLKLLHQILNKMHGSVMIQEINKSKYDAIAAGPRLQAEILELTSEVRAAKKSKITLEKFFWEKNADHQNGQSLAFNLLVLLTQKRGQIFHKSFIDDIKIIGDIYDQYSLLIVQIVRVLLYQAQDYSHYAQLLPQDPVRKMLLEYKLPLEIVCEIVRPSVKHIATMAVQEWNQLVNTFSGAYFDCITDGTYLIKSSKQNQKWATLLSNYKSKILEVVSPSLFTFFWFLSLDSVYFPAKSYSQKIQDLKKKLEPTKKGQRSDKNEKETQRMRTLLQKLIKEQEVQRKKYNDTQQSMKKIQTQSLKNADRTMGIQLFAELFTQVCLLPRMMLQRTEALYCAKFTLEMIKANRLTINKSIKLLSFILQYVMGYLSFTTHREASNCLSVFISEILTIFNNWSDPIKLKLDLKRYLGEEDNGTKDNYPKYKEYSVKVYERVGNIIRSIKQEPYIIKNCLYVLQKLDSIPSYKQQADELAQHMNQLKQLFPTVDMRTILDRQIAIITAKKNQLPERPQEKKIGLPKPPLQEQNKLPINTQIVTNRASNLSKSPINQPNNAQNQNSFKKQIEKPSKMQQNRREDKSSERMPNKDKSSERNNFDDKSRPRFTQKKIESKQRPDQFAKKEIIQENIRKIDPKPYIPENKTTVERIQTKAELPIPAVGPPKTVKAMREERQKLQNTNPKITNNNASLPTLATQTAPLPVHPNIITPSNSNHSSIANASININNNVASNVSGPTIGVQQSGSNLSNSNAAKPSQKNKQITEGQTQNFQKPNSQAHDSLPAIIQTIKTQIQNKYNSTQNNSQKVPKEKELQKQKPENKQSQKIQINQKISEIDKVQKVQPKLSISPQAKRKQSRWKEPEEIPNQRTKQQPQIKDRDNKERERDNRDKDNKNRGTSNNRDHRQIREKDRQPRDNKDRDDHDNKSKTPTYTYNRDRNKSQERRQQLRKQEKKERQKDKDRDSRRHDKYRSRSREKYGRR